MGQSLCTNTSFQSTDFKINYLEFQYGQDEKIGKIDRSNTDTIKIKPNNLNIEDKVQQAVSKLNKSQYLYKDPTIPHDKLILKSIVKDSDQIQSIETSFLRPYKFLNDSQKNKPNKILKPDDSFSDYIVVNDEVMQYFGVFLCFLANNPKIIQDIIITQSNSYGLYIIKMRIQGKETPIYIDDYILCAQQRPFFTQPIKNIYIWPNLLEKAWFKTHGFTERIIQKSTPDEVFESFISHPYKKYPLQGQSLQIIKRLLKIHLHTLNHQYGYILTTKKQTEVMIGITGKKYLYLIGTLQYNDTYLYYIRNPCIQFNFRGSYNPRQLPEDLKNLVKKNFNCIVIPEGNFLIDQTEFIQQISGFAICYYSKTLKTTSHALQLQNNNEIYLQTDLKATGPLALYFRQQSSNKRNIENRYCPLTYQVFNMANGQLVSDQQNVEGCFGVHNTYLFNEVSKKVSQGKYLIRLKKKDKKKYYPGIQSQLIANFPMELKFDIKNQHQFSELFIEYLKKQGKRILSKQNNSEKKKIGINPIDQIPFQLCDLVCIYIQYVNPKEQDYKIEISFPQLINLELIYPQINLNKESVLPKVLGTNNKEEIIVFQKIDLTAQTQLGAYELQAF